MDEKIYSELHINQLNKVIKSNFNHLSPIQKDFNLSLRGIARLVMLDRYSQKDKELKTLQSGDLVLTIIKHDLNFPSKGIGKIIGKFFDKNDILFWIIEIEEEFAANIDPNFCYQNNPYQIVKQTFEIEKPLELFYEQIAWRVAKEIANQEKEENLKEKYFQVFYEQIKDFKIIPAGRILHGAGSRSKVTYFNCYVMPYIPDSRSGISRHREEVMEIMSRGGGVGTNGSTLRPKGAIVNSVGGKSSGSVSWLNDLSLLTNLVEQGGSRRGAQMIMLNDWHPDIVEFIVAKVQNSEILGWLLENTEDNLIKKEIRNKLELVNSPEPGKKWKVRRPEFLSGANISICISDKFMEAVKNDEVWDLVFPDLENYSPSEKEFYDKHWHQVGNAYDWEKKGYKLKKYYSIRAKELWNLIIFCATYSAEPGIFFIDRANKFTNCQGYDQKIVATNPCGEQPLPPYSVCNLSAINLASFVNKKTGEIWWNQLQETVRNCIRFQDNVIDASFYFLEKNTIQAKGERRIGMGVMGLHDFLIYTGLRYGSSEANSLVDKLFETICLNAYEASIELAQEKGTFPLLTDRKKFVEKSGFIQSLPVSIQNKIEKYGLRNSHLLTVAPTGSTGTLVGVSTGLEPYFAFSHFRSGRLGNRIKVSYPIVKEWLNYHPEFSSSQLPDIFVSAMELTPEEHVDIQCTIQRWVDGSISKTVNAEKGYEVNQVKKIYERLFEKGAKGGTVYVDGSRNLQVLNLDEEKGNQFPKLEINKCNVCLEGILVLMNGCQTCNRCHYQARCDL